MSFDLLSKEEQKLYSRLAVFADNFILESAESVCGFGLEESTFDLLES